MTVESTELMVTPNSAWRHSHSSLRSSTGSGIRNPEDAFVIGTRARNLGCAGTVAILHDHGGQLKPLAPAQKAVYERLRELKTSLFSFSHFDSFQENIVRGAENDWHCRAGGRFLYRGRPGATISCVQQTAMLDDFRERPRETLEGIVARRRAVMGKLVVNVLRVKK